MKHRAHVLHQQLKGFVQRRGHIVLRDSLPAKTEHVLFVRMTPIQRRLYRRFMEELITNRYDDCLVELLTNLHNHGEGPY